MNSFLSALSIINLTSSELRLYDNHSNADLFVMDFLTNLNEGHRMVNDMCETLDETYSLYSGSNKPDCNYNVSYVNNNDIIVYEINKNIKSFFLLEKREFCKKEKFECGELTILLKMIDLINSAIKIVTLNNSYEQLVFNLKIIEFSDLMNLYKSSLFNNEIITNITLAKQKSNIILTKEKNRLNIEKNKAALTKLTDNIGVWVGLPIKNVVYWGGETLSETITTVLPTLSIELKIISGFIVYFLIKLKI